MGRHNHLFTRGTVAGKATTTPLGVRTQAAALAAKAMLVDDPSIANADTQAAVAELLDATYRMRHKAVRHYLQGVSDESADYLDYLEDTVLAVYKALVGYDPARGTKFTTYLGWWLRQAMRDAHLGRTRFCLPKRSGVGARVEFEGFADALEADPSPEEQEAHTREVREVLDPLLASLTPRHRRLIAMRYGLDGFSRHTLAEAGAAMGVTRERVRQLETYILGKMRGLVEARGDAGDAA
jgi:RNA polymerase primary sigma factor